MTRFNSFITFAFVAFMATFVNPAQAQDQAIDMAALHEQMLYGDVAPMPQPLPTREVSLAMANTMDQAVAEVMDVYSFQSVTPTNWTAAQTMWRFQAEKFAVFANVSRSKFADADIMVGVEGRLVKNIGFQVRGRILAPNRANNFMTCPEGTCDAGTQTEIAALVGFDTGAGDAGWWSNRSFFHVGVSATLSTLDRMPSKQGAISALLAQALTTRSFADDRLYIEAGASMSHPIRSNSRPDTVVIYNGREIPLDIEQDGDRTYVGFHDNGMTAVDAHIKGCGRHWIHGSESSLSVNGCLNSSLMTQRRAGSLIRVGPSISATFVTAGGRLSITPEIEYSAPVAGDRRFIDTPSGRTSIRPFAVFGLYGQINL